MEFRNKLCVAAVLCVGILGAPASNAEILEYNHAFSYTEVGSETISYGEHTAVAGYDLNMSQTVTNVVQRSGGYTPIGNSAGFYVHTATTLDALPTREYWNLGSFGSVQSNERKVKWNELNMLASWKFRDSGIQMVAGASMSTLAFIRSGFKEEAGGASFDAAVKAANPTDPYAGFSVPGVIKATDGTTYVSPAAVTEDSTNIVLNMGIRYDSTFIDPDEKTRFLMGILIGIPAYYKVENSNFPGARWVSNFKGYDVQANIGYGFKVFEDFMLSSHVEFLYKFRPQTDGVAVAGGTGVIPDVTIWNLRAALGLEWSY